MHVSSAAHIAVGFTAPKFIHWFAHELSRQLVMKVDAALQERLKRVRGEPSGSTERRVFVGGMPFSYEACPFPF